MHGAGEEPAVWEGWDGWAVDLQAGLTVRDASLLNYEAVVSCDAWLTERPLCLVGRGMGAVVVQLAARRVEPAALVLIDPWPAEGSESLTAAGTRPESDVVLAECREGVSVEPAPAPTLVVDNSEVDPQAVFAWARSAST